jgi:hypothetical protein
MRHRLSTGEEAFCVHEVYLRDDGQVATYTEDALSPRVASLDELRSALVNLLEQNQEEVVCGDLGYGYDREYVEEWLESLQLPVLDYEQRCASHTCDARG